MNDNEYHRRKYDGIMREIRQKNDIKYGEKIGELNETILSELSRKPVVRLIYNNKNILNLLQSSLIFATVIMLIVMLWKKDYEDMIYVLIPFGSALTIKLLTTYMQTVTGHSKRVLKIFHEVYNSHMK